LKKYWFKVSINGFSGIYKGEWCSKMVPHGIGQFIYDLDGTNYTGQFNYGSKHGEGVEIYICGS